MPGLDNPLHVAFLLFMLLLIFGAKRLPEMGRSLGSGLRGVKEAISGESEPPRSELTAAVIQPVGHDAETVAPPTRRGPDQGYAGHHVQA